MLTPRENLFETVRGGNPDRYVNQFSAFGPIWFTPQNMRYPDPEYCGKPQKDCWGVTYSWGEGTPGAFPLTDPAHVVVEDIEHWRDYVSMPSVEFSDAEWEPILEEVERIDTTQHVLLQGLYPGLFETCHSFMPIDEFLVSLYTEPEAVHDMIKFIAEYELKLAEQICEHVRPEALMRGDDWGTQVSTFMSRDMFLEFFFEPTKELYSYYKDHGVQLIVHHCDSFCETLVPDMIEMGIDIWQGALDTNDIPGILEEYGDKLTIMGGINNAKVDFEGWTEEAIEQNVRRVCEWAGTKHFIPSMCAAADLSNYEGVFECVSEKIDMMSEEKFGGR